MKKLIVLCILVSMLTAAANAAPIAKYDMDSAVDIGGLMSYPDITGNGHDLGMNQGNKPPEFSSDNPFNLLSGLSGLFRTTNTYGYANNAAGMNLQGAGDAWRMAMEAWIKPESFSVSDNEIIKLRDPGDYLSLGISSTGVPYTHIQINTVGMGHHVSDAAIPLNQWTHLAMVMNYELVGATWTAHDMLYVNGVLKVDDTRILSQGLPSSLGTNAMIGGWADNRFDGLIDDVGIYDDALSQAQLGFNQAYTTDSNGITMSVPANTAIFKQGYNGYYGCRDKSFFPSAPDYSYGDYTLLRFGGVPQGAYVGGFGPGLIGFDNIFGLGQGQVPSDAFITGAKLRVYITDIVEDPCATNYIKLWPMRTDWVEGYSGIEQGSSCLNARNYRADANDYAADPNYTWGYTGGVENGPVASTDSSPVDPCDYKKGIAEIFTTEPIDGLTTDSWIEFNVASFVKVWQDGTLVNNGIYGYSNGYWDYIQWRSSEYMSDPNKRPELVITYEPLACGHPGVPYPLGDISGPGSVADCYVDIYDAGEMASSWIDCTNPGQPGCVELVPTAVIPPGTATVDANLSDWSGATWIPLDKLYDGTSGDINEAKFTVRWDAATDKIYAAVIVDDNDHVIADFPFAWDSHDHVEIYSQGDPTSGNSYDPNYVIAQQYLVGKGVTAGYEWGFWGDGSGLAGDAEFEYAADVNGSQFIYEVGVKQFMTYGGKSAYPTVIRQLAAGDVVGFDVVAFSRYTGNYEMKSENTMAGKYNTASAFRQYTLLASDCGRWGYHEADINEDCKVDFADFADMADNWMYCTDPNNQIDCDQSWR